MKPQHFLGDPIKADLRTSIRTGDLKPGEQLPPFRALAEHYKVSLNTIQRVIREMVAEKVLETTHGRGTFVASSKRLSSATPFGVGVYARTTGDFYSEVFATLRDALNGFGAASIVLDPEQVSSAYLRQLRLRELLSGRSTALVVDGALDTNPALGKALLGTELLRAAARLRDPIVINRWEHPETVDASFILFDYEGAGYLAARYLHGLEHRRIAFHSFGNPLAPHAYEDDLYRGMQRFNQEAGGPLRIELVAPGREEGSAGTERMRAAFSRPDRPTAVMLAADFLAEPWFMHLPRLGLRVPRDVSMVGFFNTPWTRRLPVSLTSVQFNVEKLALSVVQHIVAQREAERATRERLLIEPSLVLCDSCAQLGSMD
ncbi:MAG: LacI family transcriptional regulator [Planctomycetota bacterium]|nr:LacI family transcriptional regulator [Planctomycetota bacterium]